MLPSDWCDEDGVPSAAAVAMLQLFFGPLPPAHLAELMAVSEPAACRTMYGLAQRGLVEFVADSFQLTPGGRATAEELHASE